MFTFVFLGTFSLGLTSKAETIEIKLNIGELRLRVNPESHSESCGTAATGTEFNSLKEVNGWYQIETNNPDCPTAWIHSYYTKKYYSGPKSRTFLENWNPKSIRVKTSGGGLKLRTKPGSKNTCGVIASGTEVERLVSYKGWYLVKTNNRRCPTAWIHGYYTEGQYEGPQNRSFLQSWRPDVSKIVDEIHTTENSAISIADQDNVKDIDSSSKEQKAYLNESIPLDEDAVVKTKSKDENEIGTSDDSSDSTRIYNATDDENKLCTFLKNNSDTKTTEVDLIKTNNCKKLINLANQGKISKDALLYTLQYLKLNLGELQDNSCALAGQSSAPKGIKNSCQFVINDMNKRISGYPNRSPSYFIDLCDGGSNSSGHGLITKSFANRGTGSTDGSYSDESKKLNTTVIGPFLTGELSPFTPFRITDAYKNIGWSKCTDGLKNCSVLRLNLYGLTSSNNTTAKGKPMHVSPYKSSWGCPSVPLYNRWQLVELNKNGPSLVMNYGPKKYHSRSSLTNCKNE